MEKTLKPIRKKIVASFYQILIFSIIATIVTWLIIFGIYFLFSNKINPANHYENQIPEILEYARKMEQVLSIEAKEELEKQIPLEGMDYQVLNKHGELLYGSISTPYIKNEKELVESINDYLYVRNNIIRYYPLYNENDEFIGAIGFRYKLTLASANPQLKPIILLMGALFLFCPFVYFYLFSYLVGKRMSKQLEGPFNSLMVGVKKVQHHDLDFQLEEFKTVQELNQLTEAFEEMRAALKDSLLRQWQIEEERKDMIASIAHDLRTPLTIIHGHVEGLLAGGAKDPERLERYLNTIFGSTERAIRLLNQLGTVALIDEPEFTIEPQLVDVKEFIENKSNEYRILCAEKNIRFTTDVKLNRANSVMHIDCHRISQVLDNILANSIRHSPMNGEIHWETTIDEESIHFKVTDNGPGFQTENLERVFSKFYREDSSRSGSNFGLGLYIASVIVKKHNGSISVGNRQEGGAYAEVVIREME